jgi:hypothetical protein
LHQPMISLSDSELAAIMDAAKPIPPRDRLKRALAWARRA